MPSTLQKKFSKRPSLTPIPTIPLEVRNYIDDDTSIDVYSIYAAVILHFPPPQTRYNPNLPPILELTPDHESSCSTISGGNGSFEVSSSPESQSALQSASQEVLLGHGIHHAGFVAGGADILAMTFNRYTKVSSTSRWEENRVDFIAKVFFP